MSDPILTARLDELEQHLEDAEANCLGWNSMSFQLPGSIREGFRKAIMNEIRDHSNILKDIRGMLKSVEDVKDSKKNNDNLKKAWLLYAEVYVKCQKFFSEYMEVIGGLAFRSSVKSTIYELADDLIRNCVRDSTSFFESVSQTLPALPETLLKTLAHIIGMRFPEWTIWALPFTAHELGHLIVHEDNILKDFIKDLSKENYWALKNSQRRSQRYISELIADGFATYIMGPSYPFSVVHLRIDPTTAYHELDNQPAYAKRIYVAFAMLERMNQESGKIAKPYEDILADLTKHWKEIRRSAGQEKFLEDSDKQQLEKLAKDTMEMFYRCLRTSAKYPHEGMENGWVVAQEWSNTWSEQLEKPEDLLIDQVSSLSTFRDVLNAAWLCRIKHKHSGIKIKMIKKAAHTLCDTIKEKRLEAEGKESPGPETKKIASSQLNVSY